MTDDKQVGEAKFDFDRIQEYAQALIDALDPGKMLEHIPVARTVRSIITLRFGIPVASAAGTPGCVGAFPQI